MIDIEDILIRIYTIVIVGFGAFYFGYASYITRLEGLVVVPYIFSFICGCGIGGILILVEISIKDIIADVKRNKRKLA